MAPSSVPETAEGSPCRQNRARRDLPASCPAPQAPKQLLRYRSFLIINYFKHKKQMKNDTATPTSGPNLQCWLGFPLAPASLGPRGLLPGAGRPLSLAVGLCPWPPCAARLIGSSLGCWLLLLLLGVTHLPTVGLGSGSEGAPSGTPTIQSRRCVWGVREGTRSASG